MGSRNRGKASSLQHGLSSLSSHINDWSTSKPTSPVWKKPNLSKDKIREVDSQELNLIPNTDFDPWYQIYSPKRLVDVAIHKRKLKDVSEVLESMLEGNHTHPRILLLTGPSGSSKSTLITRLAQQLVPRYRTLGSANILQSYRTNDENIVEYNSGILYNGISHAESFQEFLCQAKYRVGSHLSMILVEDIPNVFHMGTRHAFQKQLLEWLYCSDTVLPPLVICLTECDIESESGNFESFGVDSTFTAESVLGKEVLSHPKLRRIKFNPINNSLMKRHLMNLCVVNEAPLRRVEKWAQREDFVDHLARLTGDIRSGIASLQFWATSTGTTLTLARDNFVSYFHAVGRVLHGSHETPDDNEMINLLISDCKGQLSNHYFRLGLLENYGQVKKGRYDIRAACRITDSLSQSDIMEEVPEALEYAMRNVRATFHGIHSEGNNHGKANFPREWKIRKSQNDFKIQCDDYNNVSIYKYQQNRRFKDIVVHFGFYDPFIQKVRYYKKKSLQQYMRQLTSSHEISNIVTRNADTFQVDPTIDILERIGGDIKVIGVENGAFSAEDAESVAIKSLESLKANRDKKLKRLMEIQEKQMVPISEYQEEQNEMFETDPIVDSEEENEDPNRSSPEDDDDDSIYELLSQKKPKTSRKVIVNESLSDSDLEHL